MLSKLSKQFCFFSCPDSYPRATTHGCIEMNQYIHVVKSSVVVLLCTRSVKTVVVLDVAPQLIICWLFCRAKRGVEEGELEEGQLPGPPDGGRRELSPASREARRCGAQIVASASSGLL